MKTCSTCKISKEESMFYRDARKKDGLYSFCKDCHNVRVAKWQKEHPEQTIKTTREWQKKHPERVRAAVRKYEKRNPEKAKEWHFRYRRAHPEGAARRRDKARSTAQGALHHRMGVSMRHALKRNKSGYHWESLVGYTVIDLKEHLETLFQPGMTWENREEWHIDHKIPQVRFDYSKPEDKDFKRCWALDNLQPLWAIDNLRKSIYAMAVGG
jgi:hypothetical protein